MVCISTMCKYLPHNRGTTAIAAVATAMKLLGVTTIYRHLGV